MSNESYNNCIAQLQRIFVEESLKLHCLLLTDSYKRRSLLILIENFIYLEWSQNKFTLLKHPIIRIIGLELFKIAGEIQFSQEKIWFTGTSKVCLFNLVPHSSSSTQTSCYIKKSVENSQLLNSVTYFSIGITLLGLTNANVSSEQYNIFFKRLDIIFSSSTSAFVQTLIENDERFLITFIAIMKLYSTSQNILPTILNPELIFFILLQKVNFDTSVFIDWAYSEPELCFLLLKSFTQYFKQITFKQFKIIFQKLKNENYQLSTNFVIQHIKESSPPSNHNNINNFKFNIEELHGEKTIYKQIEISTQPKNIILEKLEDHFNNYEIFEHSFILFCEELSIKLNKLADALNFPSEKICQNLLLIISIISNQKRIK
ncbi:hypothetical protein Mgra_00002253 [Meloidogyne graminicola]|uniref:Uncharacterized protein n=1 Tax=Meloidogyne graminicola TaxID=189291 RepID=A0A8S9ZYT2_9BILA|nr:hypothetical protein Mgra_00002253 [Meloidogyne graminicola]